MNSTIGKLAGKGIFFGSSSWKYPGWQGLVYKHPYKSDKEFQELSLEEYAQHYSLVGIDHTYYAWPNDRLFTKYNNQTPDGFKFGLKATEKVTVFQYPQIKRYGKDAGKKNDHFLNAELFIENFLGNIDAIRNKVGVIMFEFSQFHPGSIESGAEFVDRLGIFLKKIRKASSLPFAIELRNKNWLKPAYFEMLSKSGVSHVFNSWTKMPSLLEQEGLAHGFSFPSYVARLLLQPGTKYAEAVEEYAPYDKIHSVLGDVRMGAVALVLEALERNVPAYILVNNRCEGCAPKTIEGILEILGAKINPL